MLKIINFCLVLTFFLLISGTSDGAKYQCNMSGSSHWCLIDRLNLTRDNFKIEPMAGNLSAVTIIVLRGTVPFLSVKKICEVMPNLKEIYAYNVSTQEIQENTFLSCKNLRGLYIYNNNFIKLQQNSFKGLSNLEKLEISGGNLATFDEGLRALKSLKKLFITNLNIVNFPADQLREQKNLEQLYITTNNLFDLNVEEIIKDKPKLKEVYLNDNNFKCDRLKEILDTLKKNNIKAGTLIYISRRRSYTPPNIDEIMCLTDEQWDSEFSKLPLDQQLMTNKLEFLHKNLTFAITKIEMLQKNHGESVSKIKTEFNDDFENLRNQNKNFIENHEEKVSNLEKNLKKLQETNEEQTSNLKSNLKTIMGIVNEQLNDEQLNTLNDDVDRLEEKLNTLENNQTEKILDLEKTVNSGFESLQTKIEAIDYKMSQFTETLQMLTEKIQKQDSQIVKIQESLSKKFETHAELTSNLVLAMSSNINMVDQKLKNSEIEANKKFQKLYDEVQILKNETLIENRR